VGRSKQKEAKDQNRKEIKTLEHQKAASESRKESEEEVESRKKVPWKKRTSSETKNKHTKGNQETTPPLRRRLRSAKSDSLLILTRI
jgi:hypothetical protein